MLVTHLLAQGQVLAQGPDWIRFDVASFVEDAQARIEAEVELPAGYRGEDGGQFENLQAASTRRSGPTRAARTRSISATSTTRGSCTPSSRSGWRARCRSRAGHG